jgi:uncharacterized protein (TIGR03382 family)
MKTFTTALLAAASLFAATAANAVELELALLVDVSGSVDSTEYALQKGGYVAAFQDAAIHAAIAATPGGIAVSYIEWSGGGEQAKLVNWTILTDAASSNAFAAAIAATSRAFSGLTAPGSAIAFGAAEIAGNGIDADRAVIDVSGDGVENDGINTATARNAALAGGVDTINGIAIGNGSLLAWYAANIVGGTNAFALGADSFDDFEAAIEDKLFREITETPTPASLALFGLGLVALGFARRRG